MRGGRRFWIRVNKTSDGCWNWTGAKTSQGYGVVWIIGGKGKRIYAHRKSWEIIHGAVPATMEVLHHCDNPSCVRPGHLFLGTQADNMADMNRKGRLRVLRGEENCWAKLNAAAVKIIRSMVPFETGDVPELAQQFGVSVASVRDAACRRSWKHVA